MKEIKIADGTDKTRELRALFLEDDTHIKFLDTEIIANGMLEEDAANFMYGDVGDAGVIRIEGRKNLVIEGNSKENKTVFKITEEAIKVTPERNHHLSSVRSQLKLIDCENITFKNIDFEGLNNVEGGKPNYAVYDAAKYGEHAIDLSGCKNITFIDCNARFIFGDGFYLRQGKIPNTNIKFINCDSYWNGRQGYGITHADGVLIDGANIVSRRSGIDNEPNGDQYSIKNVIIRNCYIKSHLLPFPMGGNGLLDGVLIENNTYNTTSPTTIIRHNKLHGMRNNIIFRGNTREGTFGSPAFAYEIHRAQNVLIEDEVCGLTAGRSGKNSLLAHCKNVVIRNNDLPDAKWVLLYQTEETEVKIYGNKQALQYKLVSIGEDAWIDPLPNIVDIKEYNVKELGEPNVPSDPTWEGMEDVIEEPTEKEIPEEETSEVEGEEIPPIEIPEPTKKESFIRKHLKWIILGIAVVIALIITL